MRVSSFLWAECVRVRSCSKLIGISMPRPNRPPTALGIRYIDDSGGVGQSAKKEEKGMGVKYNFLVTASIYYTSVVSYVLKCYSKITKFGNAGLFVM